LRLAPLAPMIALAGLLALPGPGVAREPRGKQEILARIDQLLGEELAGWCRAVELAYPPRTTLLRVFKRERELELWAGAGPGEPLRLVRSLPVCALDDRPGPKLKPYDGKTPEGFFRLGFGFQSRWDWMWMRLEAGHLDEPGRAGVGSTFQLPLGYPTEVDADHSRAAGFRVPDPAISLHGNCVTAGCISMRNRDFLAVFAFVAHHARARQGRVQLHVFPFRFDRPWSLERESAGYVHLRALGPERLRRFWENLEQGFERFEATRAPLRIEIAPAARGPKDARQPRRYRFR